MVARIGLEVNGLDRVIKKCKSNMTGQPLRHFFEAATALVQERIRGLTPRRTGKLQGSLDRQVDKKAIPTWGKVFTPLFYGPYQERGTKRGVRPHYMFQKGKETSRGKIGGLLGKAGNEIGRKWEA